MFIQGIFLQGQSRSHRSKPCGDFLLPQDGPHTCSLAYKILGGLAGHSLPPFFSLVLWAQVLYLCSVCLGPALITPAQPWVLSLMKPSSGEGGLSDEVGWAPGVWSTRIFRTEDPEAVKTHTGGMGGHSALKKQPPLDQTDGWGQSLSGLSSSHQQWSAWSLGGNTLTTEAKISG